MVRSEDQIFVTRLSIATKPWYISLSEETFLESFMYIIRSRLVGGFLSGRIQPLHVHNGRKLASNCNCRHKKKTSTIEVHSWMFERYQVATTLSNNVIKSLVASLVWKCCLISHLKPWSERRERCERHHDYDINMTISQNWLHSSWHDLPF